ncbi:MAG TPA: flagellar type III secretion system pore protein FliP [Albidovulum sp.]|uniref:flagellar type III secretion system pore protein FliP n=1 Tax=Albidovulum sp. TaxID=1872424 RepID=UPI002C8A9FAB|nr:flagellar type III secretion system pore protein FliP [Albidovulum sp.]
MRSDRLWFARAAGVAALLLSAASPAAAQEIALGSGTLTGQSLFIISAVTILSLAPGLAVMVTCFPFIVTVLSILRQGIGLQQSPPNMLIVSLALFLTWFIMEPVMTEAWRVGISPLIDGTIDASTAFERGITPFRGFMAARLDPDTLQELAALRPGAIAITDPTQAPLSLLVPSFMLSEMSRAFEIGFLLYLPFLVIDLVVAAVLMSMGMMMVPPAVVSLPFKLAFFVMADGWSLVSGALVRSYM